MKTKKALVASVIGVLFLFSIVSFANAQVRNPTGTANSVSKAWAGVDINDFSGTVSLGSTVYVFWTGVSPPATGTVYVTIYNPDGSMLSTSGPYTPAQSGTPSFVASLPGNYYIVLDGYPSYHLVTTFVAGVSLFVLPESVFGTLAAVGAGFAAVGTVKLYRKRK
jgi:hypothetical protein